MKRKIRDLVVTLAALFALFAMLTAINPRVRDRTGELAGGITNQSWDASRSALGNTVASLVSLATGYADDNAYLFAFLVVACVLFVLMLRT